MQRKDSLGRKRVALCVICATFISIGLVGWCEPQEDINWCDVSSSWTMPLVIFVFAGVPFDLKVTTYKDAWRGKAGNLSKDDKTSLARDYFEDGDKGRTRKEDEDGYGLNRIFVLIKDDNRWLDNPTGKLDELIKQMKEAEKGGPLKVNVKVGKEKEERTIKCLVFEV